MKKTSAVQAYFFSYYLNKKRDRKKMIGGHGRPSDVSVVTLRIYDHLVLDEDSNLYVNDIVANKITCSELAGLKDIPLFISSNITFGEDVAFEKDIIFEGGNVIAGTTGLITIDGNLTVNGVVNISSGFTSNNSGQIQGNLTVGKELIVTGLTTMKNGLDVDGDVAFDGDLVLNGAGAFEANITVAGDIECSGNLRLLGPGLASLYGGTGHIEYSVGDLLYAAGNTLITLERLPIGDTGNILTINGNGLPIWGAPIPSPSLESPGFITLYASASAPPGCLLCNGGVYNVVDYLDLFNVIGYTFGGAGLTFNVPNISTPLVGVNYVIKH